MSNIIVTGAKGNLGIALVKRCLNKGHNVIACISQLDAELGIDQSNVEVFPLDLTNNEACDIFFETAIGKYKTIDSIVVTVGGFKMGNLDVVKPEDFAKMFSLNFLTAFNLIQPVFKHMKTMQNGGKIVLIGAEPGLNGKNAKECIAYGFSKSLLFRLAELLNYEGNDKGISAEIIVIGTMDTPQNRLSNPDADYSTWTTPELLADKIESLCTDHTKERKEKSLITGL